MTRFFRNCAVFEQWLVDAPAVDFVERLDDEDE